MCSCGHDETDHGLWPVGCIHCACAKLDDVLELQAELDELERTDPDVRAAAESYDRMVARVTGRTLPPVIR